MIMNCESPRFWWWLRGGLTQIISSATHGGNEEGLFVVDVVYEMTEVSVCDKLSDA